MDKSKYFAFVLLAAALIVSACTPTAGEPTPDATKIFMAAQLTMAAEEESAEAAQAPAEPAAEEPAPAEPEPTATTAPTSTPSEAMLSVSVDTNCRTGPGDVYEVVGYLEVGQKARIVGHDDSGNFFVIENPQGGEDCWVWGQYVGTEGDWASLPVVLSPHTPTPNKSWAGTWTMQIGGSVYAVVLTQESKIIYGIFNDGSGDIKFNGVVSGDNTTVNGKFVDEDGKEGTFSFKMVAGTFNQFQGVGNPPSGKSWAWCGGRNGAGLPATCQP
jgi:hypothetical protein